MDASLRTSFSKIRTELDNHLDSINENTNEINSNFDHILRLEEKIDKLSERIDEIHMFFSSLTSENKVDETRFENVNLNLREQEVFIALYSSENDMNHFNIAKNLGLTVELVDKYLESMIQKGVPIIKKYDNNKIFFSIDPDFKNVQAKKNILHINEKVSESIDN